MDPAGDPPHHAVPPGPERPLRRGWTTGTCAAAAAKSAASALLRGDFLDPVDIPLPGGGRPAFALAFGRREGDAAVAGIVKDAGDDPDVTHGAVVWARVARAADGIAFRAGEGVGTVTLPGLPLAPGEPAINPVPRAMIAAALAEVDAGGFVVEVGVEGGRELARRTLNGRLGIVGGLSILGTTGIVVPYSCAAWIHSIHRGIDVARASGLVHLACATGSVTERAVQQLYGLPDAGLIEMGDFAGGTLKYLRAHPMARVTVAGGVAKMTKLAQGRLDLHSKRGAADLAALGRLAEAAGGSGALAGRIAGANTVAEAFSHAARDGVALGDAVAAGAAAVAAGVLRDAPIALDVAVFDRDGRLVGLSPPQPGRNLRT